MPRNYTIKELNTYTKMLSSFPSEKVKYTPSQIERFGFKWNAWRVIMDQAESLGEGCGYSATNKGSKIRPETKHKQFLVWLEKHIPQELQGEPMYLFRQGFERIHALHPTRGNPKGNPGYTNGRSLRTPDDIPYIPQRHPRESDKEYALYCAYYNLFGKSRSLRNAWRIWAYQQGLISEQMFFTGANHQSEPFNNLWSQYENEVYTVCSLYDWERRIKIDDRLKKPTIALAASVLAGEINADDFLS